MTDDPVAHESVFGHIDFGPVRFPVVVDLPAILPELALLGFMRTEVECDASTGVGERSDCTGRTDGGRSYTGRSATGRLDIGCSDPGRSDGARSDGNRHIGPTIFVRAVSGAGSIDGPDSASESDLDLASQLTTTVGHIVEVEIVEAGHPVGSSCGASVTAPGTRYGAPVPGGGQFDSLSSAAHAVLSVMTERVVRVESDWVHLHAAAVVAHGAGVVIPAVSGSGKTTLATELGRFGGVLTDELVAIDRPAGLVRAPQRPLSVKASGFARLVAGHPDLPAPPSGATVIHVPLEAIGLVHVGAVTPSIVVLPDRRPGECVITPADPGEVLMALVANSYDLDVDPERAFGDLVWLAGTCHGLHVAYGDAANVAPVLAAWMADHPDPPAHEVVRTDRVDDGVFAAAMGIGEVRWQPATRDVAWIEV